MAKKRSSRKKRPGGAKPAVANGDRWFRTRWECAKAIGVSDKSLQTWAKEDWFPADARDGKRRWNADAIMRVLPASKKTAQAVQPTAEQQQRAELRLAREAIEFKTKEVELEAKLDRIRSQRGQLLPLAKQQAMLAELLTWGAEVFDQAPHLIAAAVDPEVRDEVETVARRELEQFQRTLHERLNDINEGRA